MKCLIEATIFEESLKERML